VTACAAHERGFLSLWLSGRVGMLPPRPAGGCELELTVGQQLAARYQPHLLTSTTCWAGPSRCAPWPRAAAPFPRSSLGGWKPFVW